MIRSNLNTKGFFLIKIILFYLILSLKCYSDNAEANANLVVLGQDNAIVKIKIFSSLTCPHCANFHTKVVPKIKITLIRKNILIFKLDVIIFLLSQEAAKENLLYLYFLFHLFFSQIFLMNYL